VGGVEVYGGPFWTASHSRDSGSIAPKSTLHGTAARRSVRVSSRRRRPWRSRRCPVGSPCHRSRSARGPPPSF